LPRLNHDWPRYSLSLRRLAGARTGTPATVRRLGAAIWGCPVRCYFIRDGHIASVELLTGLSAQDAIAKAHMLFSERGHQFDGFEVWDRARLVNRHPDPYAAEHQPGAGSYPSGVIF
jgi:hypothetical protein